MIQLAIFDLDHTVLRHDSVLELTRVMYQRGHVSGGNMLKAVKASLQYRVGLLDIEKVADGVIRDLIGTSSEHFEQTARDVYLGTIRRWIRPEAVAAIRQAQRQGQRVVLPTGGMQFIPELVAQQLEIQDVVCSRVKVENGRFVAPPPTGPAAGPGKVRALQALNDVLPAQIEQATAFGDSHEDRHLFFAVGRPIAVNPDHRLRRLAVKREWSIVKWT